VELTNAERERAVESLKAAVRAGSISLDEFEARLQGVYAANSQDELELLLTLHGMQLAVPTGAPRTARRRRHAVLTLVVVTIVVVLAVTLVALQSRGRSLAKVPVSPSAPSAGSPATVPSAAAKSLTIKIVPAGAFAEHDKANQCGPVSAPVNTGSGTMTEDFYNCYLVVQFTNVGSSSVQFIPAQLKMHDYDGNIYTTHSVAPKCYDTVDVNALATLRPRRSLTVQICYPVDAGALPKTFTGFFTLAGVNTPIPPTAVVGTWGGQ
jgi:Domain of unknown function (DUF1707)